MNAENYPEPLDPDIAEWAKTLEENAREHFEERAAIREYEGGLSRREAESEARNDVLRWLSKQS
jgi:hypothetical protein